MFLGSVPNDCRGARDQVDLGGVDVSECPEASESVGDPRMDILRGRVVGVTGRFTGVVVAD